jgi:hypothetical protein
VKLLLSRINKVFQHNNGLVGTSPSLFSTTQMQDYRQHRSNINNEIGIGIIQIRILPDMNPLVIVRLISKGVFQHRFGATKKALYAP